MNKANSSLINNYLFPRSRLVIVSVFENLFMSKAPHTMYMNALP